MFSKIKREYAFFCTHPLSMRMLLLTNFTYSLVLPVIELFVGAYIIRNSSDFSLVMVFQLAQGTGIPLAFLVNGFLMGRLPIARMYAAGMLLSAISMSLMMFQQELDALGVSVAGLVMGLSYGLFWANRAFLALTTTKNENRNYYYGMETFFTTMAFIAVPFLVGVFIATSLEMQWFGSRAKGAYYVLTAGVFVLTIVASVLVGRGQFREPKSSHFLFFKFHRLWRKMLRMAALKGLGQGYIVTAPVMLIMKLVGEEGALGSIQSAGAFLSATLLYFLGRKTAPEHRLKIFGAGLFLFFLGSVANMGLYSSIGVLFFITCLVFSRPLLDLAYFPIQLGVIDFVVSREKRSEFSYIFSHEVGLYIGRLFGCGLFIAADRLGSEDVALRYTLPIIGLAQFMSIFVAKSIVNDKAWSEPPQDDLVAIDVLKEPIEL